MPPAQGWPPVSRLPRALPEHWGRGGLPDASPGPARGFAVALVWGLPAGWGPWTTLNCSFLGAALMKDPRALTQSPRMSSVDALQSTGVLAGCDALCERRGPLGASWVSLCLPRLGL